MRQERTEKIILPHDFEPRPYQQPFWNYMMGGGRKAVLVWHRRSGKDSVTWNALICKAFQRVGTYWHILPTYRQARDIIWTGMNKGGKRFIDYIPKDLIVRKHDTELLIELVNGSIIKLVGSDNTDRVVGTNPIGAVYSEYSLQRPSVADLLGPIFAENEGWQVFQFTPRGHNHAYTLWNNARQTEGWYTSRLTVDDTRAIPLQAIEDERARGMAEELVQQEYWVSFEAGQVGAYYAQQMRVAEEEGRITEVPWEPKTPVHTGWDIGFGDATAIWFMQPDPGGNWKFIDYYENSGEPLSHYVKVVKEKPYVYAYHYAPHDIGNMEWAAGEVRLDTARNLGINFTVVPRHKVEDGIDKVRQTLMGAWFDRKKCKQGIDALMSYHKEYDEERKTFRTKPEHDWSSHSADSVRYLCMGYRPARSRLIITGPRW